MKKLKFKIALLALSLPIITISACSVVNNEKHKTDQATNSITVNLIVTNKSNLVRTEENIQFVLANNQIFKEISDVSAGKFTVYHSGNEISSQIVDSNSNGKLDSIIFNSQFNALESKNFAIEYNSSAKTAHNYPQRAHAEISVNQGGKLIDGKYKGGKFISKTHQLMPEDHVPGDLQFRFEGPGWESDKTAYRLYFDHRNVIDIFGKKVPDMVLPEVGHIGYSYHKEAAWGMDILKVGPSLGIGGIGMLANNKVSRVDTAQTMYATIVEDGPLRAHTQIKHTDWDIADKSYDLTSNYSIVAGSHLTHNQLTIFPNAPNLVTGIVKHQASEVILSDKESSNDWAYIATFGKQSYVHDELGMAIIYKKSSLIKITEDDHNQLVVMKPDNGKLDYYFLGTWAQDSQAINSKLAFENYLKGEIAKLNSPLSNTVKR